MKKFATYFISKLCTYQLSIRLNQPASADQQFLPKTLALDEPPFCHVPCSRNWTKRGETTEFCNYNKNNLLMNLKATQTKTKQTKETKKQKESTGGAGLPPQPESRGRLNVPVLSLSAPARPHPTRCHSSA